MGGVSGNVEDIRQGHLSISKVRRKMFFRQEGLPFRSRNDLSFNQLFDGKDRFLPIGLFRFEKPIQSLPQIPLSTPPRELWAGWACLEIEVRRLRRSLRSMVLKKRVLGFEGSWVQVLHLTT